MSLRTPGSSSAHSLLQDKARKRERPLGETWWKRVGKRIKAEIHKIVSNSSKLASFHLYWERQMFKGSYRWTIEKKYKQWRRCRRWAKMKEIICVFCWLQWLHAGRERERRDMLRLGSEEDMKRQIACVFLFFCKALAPSQCLSHANESYLKLIELTEGQRWRREGRKVSEQGKGKLVTTLFLWYIDLSFCPPSLFYLFEVSGLMRSQWYYSNSERGKERETRGMGDK